METGEQNIENYLDFRLRGGSRERHGHIEWPLEYFRFSERERREGGRGGDRRIEFLLVHTSGSRVDV